MPSCFVSDEFCGTLVLSLIIHSVIDRTFFRLTHRHALHSHMLVNFGTPGLGGNSARTKEQATFEAAEQDLVETVDIIERTIGIIEKEIKGRPSMMQVEKARNRQRK